MANDFEKRRGPGSGVESSDLSLDRIARSVTRGSSHVGDLLLAITALTVATQQVAANTAAVADRLQKLTLKLDGLLDITAGGVDATRYAADRVADTIAQQG